MYVVLFFFFFFLHCVRKGYKKIFSSCVCKETTTVHPVGNWKMGVGRWETQSREREEVYLKIFFNVLFIDSEIHSSYGLSSMSLGKCSHLGNHHPYRDIEHFHHPRKRS